jgi:hypothetical protein
MPAGYVSLAAHRNGGETHAQRHWYGAPVHVQRHFSGRIGRPYGPDMTFLVRLGAVAGVLASLCIAVPGAIEAFTGETVGTSVVLGFSPAFAIPLLLALHIGQMRSSGRLGDVGFAVNLVGLGLFGGAAFALNIAIFPLGAGAEADLAPMTRLALLVSAAVFVTGVIVFGVAMLRARVYPRVPVWLYLLGFPPFALAARLPDTPLTSALHVVVGLAIGWLAVSLWTTWRARAPLAADAATQERSGPWVGAPAHSA